MLYRLMYQLQFKEKHKKGTSRNNKIKSEKCKNDNKQMNA